jgi:long-chain acyl-CoA synthetase
VSEARGPLDIARLLEGSRVVVVGGTGFLGKVWLSLLLCKYPDIGKVLLVVRSKTGVDSEARFWADIASSEPFAPLRAMHPGAAYEAFLRDKVEVLDADVSKPLCGLTNEQIEAYAGTIDAVVNVAGVVDFNPPLDEALLTNARGMEHLIELARVLGDVPVLHTSTCYVAGYRSGRIPEVDPRELPFPRSDELGDAQWDPAREIREGIDLVRSIKRHADDAHRIAKFEEEARRNLERRQEPTTGQVFAAEVRKVRDRYITDECGKAGTERAQYWGWTNTYTYTKSLGEQVLAASGLPFTIVRPAVIESSIAFPSPGWNEGINTMAPVMFMFMNGHMQIPASTRTSLDVIPVDMVSGGMIAALAALLEGSHAPVYHLGSSHTNQLLMHRLIEICGLYKRRHYLRTGKGNPWVNFVQAHWEPTPVTKEGFFRHGAPAFSKAARTLAQVARAAAVGPAAAVLGPTSRALQKYAEMAGRNGEIFTLFVPFMAETEYVFITDAMRGLVARMSESDRDAINWTPERIDWRHYMHEVHLPGLDKWVMPQIEEKLKRPMKALKAYASLLDVLDEAAERRDHHAALLRTEPGGLSRVTFRAWKARAGSVAARLAAAGVKPGDRVVLSAANHPDWPIAYFGILRAGAVAVPVDAGLDALGFGNILRASRAVAALVDPKVAATLDAVAEAGAVRHFDLHDATLEDDTLTAPEDIRAAADTVASIIYTSGTTGTPKGVVLTHGNFTALLAALAPIFPLGEGDRVLSVLPLHHTFEFTCGMLLPLSRGASVVYLDELTGEKVVGALKNARVTAMVGVPALWQLLERRIWEQVRARGSSAEAAFDLALALNRTLGRKLGANVGRVLFGSVHSRLGGRLKYLISGGAALPRDTAELFQGLGLPLAEGYGLTEAAPVLTVAPASISAKPGDVGKPIPNVEIVIANPDAAGVGEVLARGPNVMVGYADDPETTARTLDADGWLHTGDLGRIDRHGKLTLVGRSKDVVVSANGENVYPDDVERALGAIDGVKELVVVGVDDPRGGERVALLAVPDTEGLEGDERLRARDKAMRAVRTKLKELPPAWQPAVVLPYEAELPRTATKKVKRAGVRPIVERLLVASAAPPRPAPGARATSAVRAAVASLTRRDPDTLTAETRLRADLGFDSLMAMELSVVLEQLRGSALPADLLTMETIGELEHALGVEVAPGKPATLARPKGATARVDDEETDAHIDLPEPVRDLAKSAIARLQKEFYGAVMKPKVSGRAFIPYNRPALVVANHSSHLDMGFVKYALGSYGHNLVTLAARDYFFDTPLKRAFSENFTNLAAFDRDAGLHRTLDEVGALLRAGKTVLIFPEGTRSDDGQIKKFKGAVGFLALHHRVDVLPVWLGGTYEALPKRGVVPTRRDITARIGPPLTVDDVARLTHGMKPVEAARTVARLAQRAVETLRDGGVLDLAHLDSAHEDGPRKHPMVTLFDDLQRRFRPGQVDDPVRFYFTLGNEPEAKWTVQVGPAECRIVNGKPEDGVADCVLKTSPDIFNRIVREGYQPGVAEFMSGAVKSNDVGLLQTFTRAFSLG